jgi:hypothetical protein
MKSLYSFARFQKVPTAGVSSILLGILIFPLTFNYKILNPFNYQWLWGSGDISSAFAGWNFFRAAPLIQWPITNNPLYGSQISNSIIFSDTPPIFSIPVKIIGYLIPNQIFQYTGIEILISQILTIYFSLRIIQKYTSDFLYSAVSSMLVAEAPVILFRNQFQHYSLNLSWIAIASLYLFLNYREDTRTIRISWYWAMLIFVALTWMPYLVVFVVVFWLLYCFSKINNRKRDNFIELIWKLMGLPSLLVLIALTVDGFWGNTSNS